MNLFSLRILAAIVLGISLGGPAARASIDIDRIEESTIHFKASEGKSTPPSLKTELADLKYLGVLRPAADDAATPPYFLFTAKPCKGCLQDSGIYAIRPSGGKPTAFVQPGKIFDTKSRALLMESRAFFGHCLPRHSAPVLVVFQKERIDRRKQLQSSVLVAEPGPDHIDEKLLERHLPRLQDTLRLVKQKSCQEIEGRNRLTMTRPLDVNLRRKTDDTDDDQDERHESPDPSP